MSLASIGGLVFAIVIAIWVCWSVASLVIWLVGLV